MSSNMERVAAMPDASLYVNRDGRRADDCVDSHGGGNLIKIPRSGVGSQRFGSYKYKTKMCTHLVIAQMVERRTVDEKKNSVGRVFESLSRDIYIF